jgi:polyisoprenoid-binding protein YceI
MAISATTMLTIPTGSYELDPAHSRLGFGVRHMLTTVHGQFTAFTGRITLAGDDLEQAGAELTIDPASINTGNTDRDAHLRSADFFDVDRYPTIAFRSRRLQHDFADRFAVTGDLTIKGITRPVDLLLTLLGTATDPYGQLRLALTGTGTLSRGEFGVTWNAALDTGGFVIGDRVTLELDASAIELSTVCDS